MAASLPEQTSCMMTGAMRWQTSSQLAPGSQHALHHWTFMAAHQIV